MIRQREVISHEKTFDQRGEGSVYLGKNVKAVREKFFGAIIPVLEERFGERLIFPRRGY